MPRIYRVLCQWDAPGDVLLSEFHIVDGEIFETTCRAVAQAEADRHSAWAYEHLDIYRAAKVLEVM